MQEWPSSSLSVLAVMESLRNLPEACPRCRLLFGSQEFVEAIAALSESIDEPFGLVFDIIVETTSTQGNPLEIPAIDRKRVSNKLLLRFLLHAEATLPDGYLARLAEHIHMPAEVLDNLVNKEFMIPVRELH